jgi:hypothetical protein
MEMIGHDDEFVEGYIGTNGIVACPFLLGNLANRGQPHGIIDDLAEEWAFVLGADRDEIRAGGGIIPILQSVGLGAVSTMEEVFGFFRVIWRVWGHVEME